MSVFTSLRSHGLSVFPIVRPTKRPALKWSHYQTTPPTVDECAAWDATDRNVGVATGQVSGCIVLDLDNADALVDALERGGLPDTFTVRTPRGWHYYLQHPGGASISNRAGFLPGMDIRGDGGYVVGPGSWYVPTADEAAQGKVAGGYVVERDAPLAPVPAWLLPLLVREATDRAPAPVRTADVTSAYGLHALHNELAMLAQAQRGANLNDAINRAAFCVAQLVAGGEIVEDEAREALDEAMVAHGVADEDKATGTFERGWAAGLLEPRAAQQPIDPVAAFGERSVPLPPGEQPLQVPTAPAAFGPSFHPGHVNTNNVVPYFEGCAYIADDDAIWTPGGVALKRSAFDGIYGGPRFYLGAEGDKPGKSAWDMFRTNEGVRLPKVWRTCFRPECAPGAVLMLEGLPYLNAYVPVQVASTPGDVEPFLSHVRRMLPVGEDAELLLHWMASHVQNPGVKFQWWPVVQGVKGNGKTLLLECMIAATGQRYSHLVNPEAMQRTGNQFNAWIENKLFLGFEEIHTNEGQHHFVDMMKSTVTNRRIASEGKGSAQRMVDNRANGIMLTNHDDAVPIEDDERRWGIFYCAQQTEGDLERDGMTGPYFPRLYDWLRAGGYAHVTWYLQTRLLEAALDPARTLHRAPETSSTARARRQSLGNVELELLELVETGAWGFRGGFISSDAARGVLERYKVGRKRWSALLARIGYVPHPRLHDGRATSPLSDGSRPRLYVTRGHPTCGLEAGGVGAAFEAAQGDTQQSNVVPFGRR